jgi:hypothetical protein
MHARKIIGILLIGSVLLALGHYLLVSQGWYYLYPFLDMPMHLLGGFVGALAAYATIVTLGGVSVSAEKSLLGVMLAVLAIAIGWELFEYTWSVTNDAGISSDTMSDILFGLVGGLVGWSAATSVRH